MPRRSATPQTNDAHTYPVIAKGTVFDQEWILVRARDGVCHLCGHGSVEVGYHFIGFDNPKFKARRADGWYALFLQSRWYEGPFATREEAERRALLYYYKGAAQC
jgi:hypothetical protein